MEIEALKRFMREGGLSANKVGKKSNIATSNLTRVLNGETKLTRELVMRIYTAFPIVLDYVVDEREREDLKVSPLPAKFVRAANGAEQFLPALTPERRAGFAARPYQNVFDLDRYKGVCELVDFEGTNKKILLHVIETDLGPRINAGDVVTAVLIDPVDWKFANGLVFVVFSNYAFIKIVKNNTLNSDKPFLDIGSDNGSIIFIPKNEIKQLYQVTSIVSGRLSF